MRSFIIQNTAVLLWSAWRRRYLIAVPIVIVPLLALLVGMISPKKYKSYTTVLIQEAAKQNPFLGDLAVATNLKTRMEALNSLLHSRHILAGVAVELGMVTDETSERNRETIVSNLSSSLTARLVGDDLIKISLVSGEPEGMRELLEVVSARFIERVVAPQRSAIASSEAFLVTELDKRRKDLSAAEQKLANYKTKFASELPNLHASNVNRLSHLRENLAERRISLEGARAARNSLRQSLAHTDPVVGRIEEAIVQEASNLAVLRARYTNNHTQVQAALRLLRSLEKERSKALRSVTKLTSDDLDRLMNRASTQTTPINATTQPFLVSQLQKLQEADSVVKGLKQEVAGLESELTELEGSVSSFGEHERRLKEMERDISISRKTFDGLAERHQKAQVTGALGRSEEGERVKLIDPPFTPATSSNPPLIIFLAAGVVGGFALGIGLAAAAELFDTTIWRREALVAMTGAPFLTRIPVLPNEGFAVEGDALDTSFFEQLKAGGNAHA
jgi:polysaccharide chain length determinant protein (PEP-CTERM system associated)